MIKIIVAKLWITNVQYKKVTKRRGFHNLLHFLHSFVFFFLNFCHTITDQVWPIYLYPLKHSALFQAVLWSSQGNFFF